MAVTPTLGTASHPGKLGANPLIVMGAEIPLMVEGISAEITGAAEEVISRGTEEELAHRSTQMLELSWELCTEWTLTIP